MPSTEVLSHALASGAVGATALTLVHESARRVVPRAPRVHVIGERLVARGARALGRRKPGRRGRYLGALAAELASNAIYYSAVGAAGPRHAPLVGAALGVAAGVGAVTLPARLGLGRRPTARTRATAMMTVAWYTAGGLAAGLAYRRLHRGR